MRDNNIRDNDRRNNTILEGSAVLISEFPSISKPIERVDARSKISGRERYVDDYVFKNMIYARLVTSTIARGKIKSIKIPETPEGYFVLDYRDIPGKNRVKMIVDDWPFLAEGEVNYIGEPILIVVGPDREVLETLIEGIRIEYEELKPVFTIEDAEKEGDKNCFVNYKIEKGDIAGAKRRAKKIIEGTYRTGLQEHIYLETQGMIALYDEGKGVSIYGSMQCPFYVKGAIEQAFNLPEDRVRIVQTTTGGGFGGKEDYPSLIAAYAAFASYRSRKPVKIILGRSEDIKLTTKRHPSRTKIKTYIDGENNILGMEIDSVLDGGAYEGLSSVVLQRDIFAATGVYRIDNVFVRGRALKTNNVPRGAFRGFGGPQAIFAIEMHMYKTAVELGLDPLEFKRKYFLNRNDITLTGGKIHADVKLEEMTEKLLFVSGYREKTERFKVINRGTYEKIGARVESESSVLERVKGVKRLKGIGFSAFNHGCGFTGSGERDKIKARVRLKELEDGRVELLVSSVEMGQGARTTLRKIVAETMGIPFENVVYDNPDTSRVPDSGPTVASRTAMIVGNIVREAALEMANRLKERNKISNEGKKGKFLEVEKTYRQPEEITWDQDRFKGDAYPDYSWGVNAIEVSVDPFTYEVTIEGIWGVFDFGVPVDSAIVKGQIEGGIAQGLGWANLEKMEEINGRLKQASITDYIIPTALDLPAIHSELVYNPSPYGPYGAKGAGEPPFVGAAPAFAAAVSNALGIIMDKIPITPELILSMVEK